MSYYTRKSPRIPNYNYSTQNYYFITICTHNRKCIFGDAARLNEIGNIAESHIQRISSHYKHIFVEKYVVMPNHIHLILVISKSGECSADQVIAQYKSGVAREIRKINPNMEIWQRSFHDHIIRTQESFEKIWLYIEGNPQCWEKDCFYISEQLR